MSTDVIVNQSQICNVVPNKNYPFCYIVCAREIPNTPHEVRFCRPQCSSLHLHTTFVVRYSFTQHYINEGFVTAT